MISSINFHKLLFIFLSACVLTDAQSVDTDAQSIDELESKLKLGLVSFSEYLQNEKPVCPQIPSKWYVDNAVKDIRDKAGFERSRRFGHILLREIDDYAGMLHNKIGDSSVELARAKHLLTISEWVMSSNCYGNLLIGSRLIDVATVSLARLVADLDVAPSEYSPLLQKLSPDVLAPKYFSEVLHFESGGQIPIVSSIDALRKAWSEGAVAHLRQPNGSRKFDFYKDDEFPPFDESARTTLALWDFKFHKQFVLGLMPQNVELVLALAKFREKVKDFPKSSPSASKSFYSDGIKGSFEKAWRPFEGDSRESRLIYVLAARAYTSLQESKFVDKDTFENLRFSKSIK